MHCDQTKNEWKCMLAIIIAMALYPFCFMAAVVLWVADLAKRYIWHIVYGLGLAGYLIMMSSFVAMGLSTLTYFQRTK
jgi:hypothetical protein